MRKIGIIEFILQSLRYKDPACMDERRFKESRREEVRERMRQELSEREREKRQ